jgi:hypothetical protein
MSTDQVDSQMTGTGEDRICLPGFGRPLEYLPIWRRYDEEWLRFPHAIADALASEGVTLRERRMLEFINQITDVGVRSLKSSIMLHILMITRAIE